MEVKAVAVLHVLEPLQGAGHRKCNRAPGIFLGSVRRLGRPFSPATNSRRNELRRFRQPNRKERIDLRNPRMELQYLQREKLETEDEAQRTGHNGQAPDRRPRTVGLTDRREHF